MEKDLEEIYAKSLSNYQYSDAIEQGLYKTLDFLIMLQISG